MIVDSGSADDTPDAIEARWPEIEVMRLPNVGFAAANNAGFAVARGRYLLALNPDTVVRWGRFRALVDAMDARPRIGAASVIQEEADGSLQSIRRDPTVSRALVGGAAAAQTARAAIACRNASSTRAPTARSARPTGSSARC